ncbi:MAG TPA: AAA family ATPase, partial [Actinomycetota bacterium]|nr:AAA family ATPase [Actinomycetota bacterium]
MVAPQHPAEKIIGREAEVTAIDRFLAGVPLGPRALVLEGAAGIGKTILWKEGLSLAAARGYRILSCQPAESETQLALTGLADLLEGYVDESLPALPEPQRDALEVALLRRLPVGPPPAQRAVSVAVLGVFRSVAKLCPTLLAVDDVQWLDGSSARVLEFAARRLTDEPIGVFLTRRVADGERAPLVLDRVVPEGRHEQIAIGPLTLGALYRLIHARLGLSFPRPTLVRIHEGSGGNPFFALELARALEQRRNKPTGIEPLPVPDTIGQLVRDRIARLPARTREVLLATSALAQPTVSLVDRVLGERGLAPAELERAVRAGLIELEGERIRFTHPLVASVHYSGTPLAERRRMHRRLAGGADEPEERARHLALGSGGPDTGVAEALDHAARKARTRGAPDAAAELAELAATLTPEERPDEARRRRVDAAEDHFAAGDSERARTLLEEAIASAQPGPERADLLVRLAWVRYNADSLTEAQAHLHRALSEAGDDSRIIAWVQFMLAMVLVWRGDLPRSVVHARRALDLAERLEDPALLGPVLTAVGMTESYAGAGIRLDLMERSIAESERAEGAVVDWRPGQMLGGLQMMGDDLDAARATLLTVHSRALERGEEGSLDDHLFWMSELESRAGNFELAAQYAAQGHEIALRAGHQRNVAQLLYIRALVEAHIGRVDQARSLAEEGLAIAESLDAVFPKIRNRTALGYLELSIGNAADARRHLEAAAGQIVASGFGEPGQFQH